MVGGARRFHRIVRAVWLLIPVLVGCAARPAPECGVTSSGRDVVYVLSRGWHTEIGLAANRLAGPLGIFRTIYPGARALMFGYGKRTFLTAPPNDISEYLLGPVPGPAVIETVGLRVSPPDAYGPEGMVALSLPTGGAERLSAFLWQSLAHDGAGKPRLVGPGGFPGSRFYAAVHGYSLVYTCNTWVADALHEAGLPVNSGGVVISGQTMARAEAAAAAQCRAAP
jgi:Protein of unknown function (DUF2459)